MIPGGTDAVISTSRPVELMELAVRWLFTHWKNAVVSSSSGNRTWCAQNYYEIPFGLSDELFVFSSVADFAASEADPDKLNYLHLLRRDNELTVVMASDSTEGPALVDTLKNTKFPEAA